jgi:hypothetical protein
MEWLIAEGRFERFPEIIRELVSIKADVLVPTVVPTTRAGGDANCPHCHGERRQSGGGALSVVGRRGRHDPTGRERG